MNKRFSLNTALLLVCAVLLKICAFGIFSRPTLQEIDQRMIMWGQHFGAVYQLNKQEAKKVVTMEAGEEPKVTE